MTVNVLAVALLGLGTFPLTQTDSQTLPDSIEKVRPPNLLKGNCPGETLSINFFKVMEDTTKVSGVPIVGADAVKLVKETSIPQEYRGMIYTFKLPELDTFWVFPTNGETYEGFADYAFVFGVKHQCVVSFSRMPIGLINKILKTPNDGPKIVPHTGPSLDI